MIAVVDYGLGNVGSVVNMLRRIGAPSRLASSRADIETAQALVLPGVGHFDSGMRNLHDRGLTTLLTERVVDRKVPILGICLGMQLFSRGSDEGQLPGLGWLDAHTRRFEFARERRLPVPHMGWSETTGHDPVLFDGANEPRYYYVHSYHVVCDDPADVAATCTYGDAFTAAIHRGHVYGTQFHPEKSHKHGMKLLESFARTVLGS